MNILVWQRTGHDGMGQELYNKQSKKEYTIIFSVIVVTVFTLYKLNLRMLSAVETWPQMVQYLGEYAIPEMMNNILLTYLVYIGGAFPAALYSAVTNIPIWLSPVLPV